MRWCKYRVVYLENNRQFPSFLVSLCLSKIFLMKMIFICIKMNLKAELIVYMNGGNRRLGTCTIVKSFGNESKLWGKMSIGWSFRTLWPSLLFWVQWGAIPNGCQINEKKIANLRSVYFDIDYTSYSLSSFYIHHQNIRRKRRPARPQWKVTIIFCCTFWTALNNHFFVHLSAKGRSINDIINYL